MIDAHLAGFEKEALFSRALKECCDAHSTFKAKTLKAALQIVSPEFMNGLSIARPCHRRLKFIGPSDNFGKFFVLGEIYNSIDFNGGTYQIYGYDRRIGCSYFEVC